MTPRSALRVGGLALALAAATGGAAAQDTLRIQGAALLLPAGHWSVAAAHRAEALGLAPNFFPAQTGASHAEVAAALRAAAARPEGGALARGWLARFREEFADSGAWLGGGGGAGYHRAHGRLAPARGIVDRAPPAPLPRLSRAVAVADGAVRLGPALSAGARLVAGEDHAEARQWEVAARLGSAALSVGRAPVGYGAPGSGLVLGSPAALPRIELRSVGAWEMPGLLRPLGRVTVHTFLSSLDGDRHATDPLLWGARVAFRPHGRVTVAVNRAAIFGGDSARMTAGRVAGMLVGTLNEGFENQVVSLEARYRLPTEAWLPLAVRAEWAAEDASGAWWDQPAALLALDAAALPGAPAVSLGVEGATFAACCGHGSWYHHSEFTGHWVARDRPLGHPLGGEGSELAVRAAAEVADARLRVAGRGFTRYRSDESARSGRGWGNLFSPTRTGRSHGAALQAHARLTGGVEATLRARGERGAGWREHSMELELRALF